ncbi:hypothetical protein NDU88_001662 [Pleurodeles waltl]|uniref:Uncharacterized protein n=1 Tax=Pleurodeles waltl TaxID=8319 RepID=A0AAV7WLJ6_PLEWA|nr:hypothetical protein NDU88_001662 [Pleurodeles waltl]
MRKRMRRWLHPKKGVRLSKQNFDRSNSVKKTIVEVGDWVLIKRPNWMDGAGKLSKNMRIIKVFRNAVKTNDHQVWNLNRVVKCRRDPVKKLGDQDTAGKDVAKKIQKSSERKIKMPVYLKDHDLK